jgi:hypothetical protein
MWLAWDILNNFLSYAKIKFPTERVKNPGTDSIFESLMNFKRDLDLLEKTNKFSKIPS